MCSYQTLYSLSMHVRYIKDMYTEINIILSNVTLKEAKGVSKAYNVVSLKPDNL